MNVDDLFGALQGIPHLPEARCVGSAKLFDEFDDPGIVSAAKSICDRCRAKPDCERFFLSLKPSERPVGVIAGRLNRPRQDRKAIA